MIHDNAGKYCCFNCPRRDYSSHFLSDCCPTCGKAYGFPLWEGPTNIGGYRALEALGRGFYAATYIARTGALNLPVVLKVAPERIYALFNKNFDEECRLHLEVSEGTEHLVGIRDYFTLDVTFGDNVLPCHVAVLNYIPGKSLDEFVRDPVECTARSIAQVAIDLFSLLDELEQKARYHNDLHSRNIIIQSLPLNARRGNQAIDDRIRAVAIDLGSIEDESLSGDGAHVGDLRFIASHLRAFVAELLRRPQQVSNIDYRLASVLEDLAYYLSSEAVNLRPPDYPDFIKQVSDSVRYVSSPWMQPPPLARFNDSYNAQTLHPWYIPQLLVDPGGQWLRSISSPGPQVITGMRGCGKTMLLRALQFHSRVSKHAQVLRPGPEMAKAVADGLKNDAYFGVYVSCTRLLDILAKDGLHEPYARLFLAYTREALRALRHLRNLDSDFVIPMFWRTLGEVVAAYLEDSEQVTDSESDLGLERRMQEMLASLDRGEVRHALRANPSIAFPHLADAILSCSNLLNNATVLFLLDDVSTRHLKQKSIEDLLSSLLFSREHCAFKITTEVQTLELILRSPGLIETARAGRDYETFDLGAAVNERMRNGEGKRFIADILALRVPHVTSAPKIEPQDHLGDTALESIARRIASVEKTDAQRKEVYHGLSALAAVCVGDIGDVISLYELMLRRYHGAASPIPPAIQSGAFQDYCSRRLYHLNRRSGNLKDFARSFAEAAYELLVRSMKDLKKGRRKRLRQYNSLYVRVTTGDTTAQFAKLLELTDAGVFVFEGGADSPRTKTHDSNPVQQFILRYRKLFGLSSYIGLADSDRFELSGTSLQEWLEDPGHGKAVLMRNLGGPLAIDETSDAQTENLLSPEQQLALFTSPIDLVEERLDGASNPANDRGVPGAALRRIPRVWSLRSAALKDAGIRTVVVGLGFEDRTLESSKRLFKRVRAENALLVSYNIKGHREAIESLARKNFETVNTVSYESLLDSDFDAPPGPLLFDVTGLGKRVIFKGIRTALERDGEVYVAHTHAKEHYPLHGEIEEILRADDEKDAYKLLENLSSIMTGDQRPYHFDKLLISDSDDSRRRLLCAPASPRHERLLSLLDERQYDRITISAPQGSSARDRLARLAADVAVRSAAVSDVVEMDSNSLEEQLQLLAEQYQKFYIEGGFDVELGLTGTKLHAVACAAISVVFKIAQCWYVRPERFDPKRFTVGSGVSHYFRIEAGNHEVEADRTSEPDSREA